MKQPQTQYQRNESILQRDVDGEVFLIDDVRGNIHALDPFASGIWRLLENPVSVNEIVAVFLAAFPDRQPKEIRRHVNRFVDSLARDNLAVSAATE